MEPSKPPLVSKWFYFSNYPEGYKLSTAIDYSYKILSSFWLLNAAAIRGWISTRLLQNTVMESFWGKYLRGKYITTTHINLFIFMTMIIFHRKIIIFREAYFTVWFISRAEWYEKDIFTLHPSSHNICIYTLLYSTYMFIYNLII